MDDRIAMIEQRVARSAACISGLSVMSGEIAGAAETIRECLWSGCKVLTCGNGGSAAEALHLAEEMIGKYNRERAALAGVCLNADPTAITCIANDFGFDRVFSRQVEGLGRDGDVLVGFSTSGNSKNVNLAFEAAKERGMKTIALLGKGGGAAGELCDHPIVIEETDTAMIQEAHQVIVHLFLEWVEGDRAP
jgi:D-sedoheptulose 7-phosphate isomerase